MLKSRQQAANRAAGIGDENGRLPSCIKKPEVMLKCTMCGQEIRATKTNTEAKAHWDSKHPTTTFAGCFPGAFDPTVAAAPAAVDAATKSMAGLKVDGAADGASAEPEKPKKKKEDLSFLDAALDPKASKPKGKK